MDKSTETESWSVVTQEIIWWDVVMDSNANGYEIFFAGGGVMAIFWK